MTEAERERAEIVAWLRDKPFPWFIRDATLWERAQAAWEILKGGQLPVRGVFLIAAQKIERLAHKGTDHAG